MVLAQVLALAQDVLTFTDTFSADYIVSFEQKALVEPALEYKIHVLEITADDRQSLQMNPSFIPSPNVQERLSHRLRLPVDHNIL
jgi:hypothetical protein